MPEEIPAVGLRAELRTVARGLRSPRGRMPKLLVFGQGRTGSTLLGDLLASHPQLHFGNEVLRARTAFPTRYLEGLRAGHPNQVFCAHVKPYHLTDFQRVHNVAGWLRRLRKRGWTIVHLQRHDVIRHALSNFSRNAVGVSHFTAADHRTAPRLVVDPTELRRWIDARAGAAVWERAVLEGLDHEVVVYESDLMTADRWQTTADRLWASVGLAPVPVSTSLRKINPQSLSDLLENYSEVAASLAGSPYERWL